MTIAIIPARGGSKRIPRKNIRPFCGQPMIRYAIQAAQAAGCFEHIVVSTDDAEIAAVARHCGAETPFLRDPTLADDHTGTTAVVVDAIRRLDDLGIQADTYCCIYATVPLIRARDLQAASTPFWPENMGKRSQDLTPAYQDAGQFYWGRREAWLGGRGVFDGNGLAQVLPRYRVVDIDTEEDWQLAELLYRVLHQHDV